MADLRLSLRYGDGRLELRLPAERLAGSWSLEQLARERLAPGADPDTAQARALAELRGAGIEAAVRGRSVGLLVADGTRSWEPRSALPGLWPLLEGARELQLFVCGGTHDPHSAVNRRLRGRLDEACRAAGRSVTLRVHDPDAPDLVAHGTTRRGTPLAVNACLGRCEALLVLADVKPHYFAGYSNPTKYVVPGLAGRETARANHALALEPLSSAGRHPWHPDPARRENPLAEDLTEAFERVVGERPCFAMTTIREGARLYGAWGGRPREVCERTFPIVDRALGLELEPVRFLVLSPGGSPHDESLYTAQRALELTGEAWRPGGEVLFLAACSGGLGPAGSRERFFEPLTRPLDELRAPARADYRLYDHKPVKLARLLRRAAALWIKSELPAADLARAHMRPVADPQAVVDDWLRRAAPGERIAAIDDASRLWVRAAGDQVPIA